MARRFGGRYSPGAAGGARRRRPKGGRLNLLFVAPFALLPGAFVGPPGELVLGLGAFALLQLAALLTREGVRAHAAFDDRTVAKPPALPRKLLGTLATALGLGAAGLADGMGTAIALAAAGGGLHLFAFGPDPLRAKLNPDGDAHQAGRVARVVEEAEANLAAMMAAVEPLRRRALTDRVERFRAAARALFRQVERDPRDLNAVRRYLGVYLEGARDATRKFATHYEATGDEDARASWEALVDDLEAGFASRTETLMIGDREGLDVEITVLRERLEREGVRLS